MRLVLYVLEKQQTAFKCGKSYWVDQKKKKKGNQRDISTAMITSTTATVTVYWTATVFYIQSRSFMYIAPLRTLHRTLTILWTKGS